MLRTPEKKVHIHVFSEGSPEIERYLLFRDHLRKNSRDYERSQKLKKQLAANDWQDMNAYADAKSEFIEEIIAVASHQER